MPKVLGLVSFRIYPTLMGGQKGVALFYEHLKAHMDVLLAASVDNEATTKLPIRNLLYPNKKMPLNLLKIDALSQLVSTEKIDVIVAEHSYTGWIAWRLHRRTGKPFIIHSHNIESKRFQQMHKWWWRWYEQYEGRIHRKAAHNFFISDEDMEFALQRFKLQKEKCSVITYGVEKKEKIADQTARRQKLHLPSEKKILLFNGTLDYTPNTEAVHCLIDEVQPLLRKKLDNYQIVITGNRAPGALLRKMEAAPDLHYAGYVDDVNEYYQAADLFINPVANDTGVKTKLIEAVANHCTSVSTESGASGIKKELCGGKLITVADDNWEAFTDEIEKALVKNSTETPAVFYDHYEWTNIAKKAAEEMIRLIQK